MVLCSEKYKKMVEFAKYIHSKEERGVSSLHIICDLQQIVYFI